MMFGPLCISPGGGWSRCVSFDEPGRDPVAIRLRPGMRGWIGEASVFHSGRVMWSRTVPRDICPVALYLLAFAEMN